MTGADKEVVYRRLINYPMRSPCLKCDQRPLLPVCCEDCKVLRFFQIAMEVQDTTQKAVDLTGGPYSICFPLGNVFRVVNDTTGREVGNQDEGESKEEFWTDFDEWLKREFTD